MSFLSNLSWRHATKSFDPSKPLNQDHVKSILNAIRMAPTSYGLQPFKAIIIQDNQAIKEEISVAAFKQPQIVQAPLVIVFCSDRDIIKRVDDYTSIKLSLNPEEKTGLQAMKSNVATMAGYFNDEQKAAWAAKQAYIALGFALAACAELQIDSCPMEGFDSSAIDRILNLPENLHTQAILTVGYRSTEPKNQKFRLPDDRLFVEIK